MTPRLITHLVALGMLAILPELFLACAPAAGPRSAVTSDKGIAARHEELPRMILDFEQPDPAVIWNDVSPPSTTRPAMKATDKPAEGIPALTRSSIRPNTGLWSLQASLRSAQQGEIVHPFAKPVDLQNEDTLLASVMQLGDAARTGEATAAIFLVDSAGKRFIGDAFPVMTRWQAIPLDLQSAAAEEGGGVDLSHITAIGLQLRHVSGVEPLTIQTDTWSAENNRHAYVGQRLGIAHSFYAQRTGTRLTVGMVGRYEVTFFQRAGTDRPWIMVAQNGGTGRESVPVLGQHGTGLMLLDQDMYDALGTSVHADAALRAPSTTATAPATSWPQTAGASQWSWECTWASPVAAIVEVKQEVGPYDRLGQPAVIVKWRFMIYQWGQIFVHVEWTRDAPASASDPISWALVLNRSTYDMADNGALQNQSPEGAQRLLSAIYPASVRQGLATALPHQMQLGAPIAMIAKTGAADTGKNAWWWASVGDKQLFGVGIARTPAPGVLDCMLLLDTPSPLMQAGSFSQYLAPPKVRTRQGELDRNFPGDTDNDGLVEPYGFQVIRLADGRASFTIYPQDRPLFYPPYLFTVPAVEGDADDVAHSRMLINIDGTQFADPPRFPDGSFLLQMPYVIDRPVQVEAVLVKN